QDVDAPSGRGLRHVLERHGERIWLLAGRGGRAPDAEAPLRASRLQQSRHDGVAEMLARNLFTEEERLAGRHRLDDLYDTGSRGSPLERLRQLRKAGQSSPPCQRQKPALDQILLVGRQHEAGAFLQQLSEEVVIKWRHDRAPAKSRTVLG